MKRSYEISLYTPQGKKIGYLNDYTSLVVTHSLNAVGTCTIEMPMSKMSQDISKYLWHARIIIEEYIPIKGTASILFETCYFVQNPIKQRKVGNIETLIIEGVDTKQILKSRIVLYPSDAAQSVKTGYADNLIKAIVRENLGDDAAQFSGYSNYFDVNGEQLDASLRKVPNLVISKDVSKAASINISVGKQNVLETIFDICTQSTAAGIPLFFSLKCDYNFHYKFETSVNELGVNRGLTSQNPLIFSDTNGMVGDYTLRYDYDNYSNVVVMGGDGVGINRDTLVVANRQSIMKDGLGWQEVFVDSRGSTSESLADIGKGEILIRTPMVKLESAKIENLPNVQFNVHYSVGDRVVVMVSDLSFDAYISDVSLNVSDGNAAYQVILTGENKLT